MQRVVPAVRTQPEPGTLQLFKPAAGPTLGRAGRDQEQTKTIVREIERSREIFEVSYAKSETATLPSSHFQTPRPRLFDCAFALLAPELPCEKNAASRLRQ